MIRTREERGGTISEDRGKVASRKADAKRGRGGAQIRGKGRRSRSWMGCAATVGGISRMNKAPTIVQVFLAGSATELLHCIPRIQP